MKKLAVLLFLFITWGCLNAQVNITTDFSVKTIKIRLKNNSKKRIKGTLFSISDSTIVIANTLHKKYFRNGNYSLQEYRLADVKFIDGTRLNSNWDEYKWARFKQKLGRQAIMENEFTHLKVRARRTYPFSKRPAKYGSCVNISFDGKRVGLGGELPLYKWNTISLGVKFRRMNVPSESFESRYIVEGYYKDDPLEEMGDYKYGKYYYAILFDKGTQQKSVAHAFGSFLPKSSIDLNADIRTYFGVKPHVILKPFAEVGLLMKGEKGYRLDIKTTVNDEYDAFRGYWDYSDDDGWFWGHTPSGSSGTEFIEKITVGDAYTKWTPKLDLNLGLKVQGTKMFFELKVGFPFKSDSWSLMKKDEYGYFYVSDARSNYKASMAFGYTF